MPRARTGHLSPTVATLAALTRLGAERTRARGLGAGDVRTLVADLLGADAGAEVAEAIRERTGGNPFYVLELARWLAAEGALTDPSHPAWRAVPGGVRDTVRQRLAELPAAVSDVIAAAAVLGPSVDLDLLEAWGGRPDDQRGAARRGAGRAPSPRAWSARMPGRGAAAADQVRPRPRPRCRLQRPPAADPPAHACASCRDRRAMPHRQARRARGGARRALPAGGPRRTPRSAWTYAERAARAATRAGASADAAAWLASAASRRPPTRSPPASSASRCSWSGAPRCAGPAGSRRHGSRCRRRPSRLWQRGDAVAAARALLVVTENVLWSWRTEHTADEGAVALWQQVLTALPAGESGLRARIVAALRSRRCTTLPGGRCEAWADEALALARRHPDDAVRIDVLQVVLNPLRRPDLLPRRVGAADELVALCVRSGDERALASALCKRALNHSAFARRRTPPGGPSARARPR